MKDYHDVEGKPVPGAAGFVRFWCRHKGFELVSVIQQTDDALIFSALSEQKTEWSLQGDSRQV
ncbi:hypothetical protein EHN07_06780 [Buttiauxella warmboldiae]|uniref:Uncharacterized protein n=1 Tax=Buttiauxella warmboldiae TaxID=82993 RepID=A0A3N5EAG0_9ENTR|nr:hypothetical protein [Buttiauxella warmboldiae]RPH29343.1 hypothetical protein EHN07_06780 [Buttiauxella warmboldiae]